MKTHVLLISKHFMKSHPRAGERTWFGEKIFQALVENPRYFFSGEYLEKVKDIPVPKIHTIRDNYEFWKKRIDQVNDGEAKLSLRSWSGKPYNSEQFELLAIERHHGFPNAGISIQKLSAIHETIDVYRGCAIATHTIFIDGKRFACIGMTPNIEVPKIHFDNYKKIAKNDGLSLVDFTSWFKKDLTDGCIIHFTQFKY